MKVLIIGGTGFIGKHLKNHFNKSFKFTTLSPTRKDLNLVDFNSCFNYLKSHKPDIVIHSAVNIASVQDSIAMFFNIVRCHRFFGRLINLGSGGEYNPSLYTAMMTEDKSVESFPDNGYFLSKFVQGREIEYGPIDNLMNLRLFGVYGEFEDYSRRFISNNICRVLSGLPISMNRDMKFDYIYMNDLCFIIEKVILKSDFKYKTYNVCSGKPVKLSDLAKIIKDVMSVNDDIIIKNSGLNPEYSGDSTKIQLEMGQFDLMPHSSSILNMVNYFTTEIKSNTNLIIKEN